MTSSHPLILGVDGGGSKTAAWLAVCPPGERAEVIGRGLSGSSNCRSVGISDATSHLKQAIDAAFADAGRAIEPVDRACLGLAGADRESERTQFEQWANRQRLAHQLIITNDALPVIFAAADDGVAIALIAGTGSVAVGRNRSGKLSRCGGWGSLLGDEGSGYQIALSGLRAAVRCADRRGPQTTLLGRMLDHFHLQQPMELIPTIYADEMSRSTIAKLATIVFDEAASDDVESLAIIDRAADELCLLVSTLATELAMNDELITLGFSGGVLLHQADFLQSIGRRLQKQAIETRLARIEHPVAGAVVMASA